MRLIFPVETRELRSESLLTMSSLQFPLLLALIAACLPAASAQTPAAAKSADKSAAYYHYSLAHLYSELAGATQNRSDYVTKAVENYRLAMKEDPGVAFLSDELSDLYIQSGRLRDGVLEAEDALKQNTNDVNARRILGRIYTRMIGDSQQGRVDENMLKKAIEQYQKIAELSPKDTDTWLMLGRLQKIASNSVESEKAYKKVLEQEPENEDALTGLAMVYVDLGNNKAASDLLRRVAEKSPSLRTLTALAGAYEQMHDYPLAAETLKKTLEVAPGNIEIKRAYAEDLLRSDKLAEALQTYQEVVTEDPRDAQSYLRMSQIYRQQRDFAKAHEAAGKAKAIDPANMEVQYNEVNLLDAEGKTSQAISLLQQMLTDSKKRSYQAPEKANRVMLLERLALLYRGNDQPKEAIETFRQEAEVDPDTGARTSANIIDTLRMAKDFKKATDEADAAVKKYPDDRLVRMVHASLLADLGKTNEAAAEMTKLLDGKNDRETYVSLAQVYEKGKNFPEMAKALDAAEKLSNSKDDKEDIAFRRGAMYEREKKYDLAEQEFRKVLELNPSNASALNYLGYMLADRNLRLPEAQQMVSKALAADPANGAYLDSLGWVYYRMDKLQEAETYLLQAMERYAKDPTVHDHLGDVYFKEGRIRDAIKQWDASLKEWENAAPSESEPNEIAKVQKKLEDAKVRLAKETPNSPPK
jgi:tetratricopeptide (TPR) repeat protein